MAVVAPEQLYTAADLWEMSRGDDRKRFELVKGELRAMSPSGGESTIVAANLLGFIIVHVKTNDLGYVTGADGGFILDEDTVRVPDVGFVAKDRMPRPIPKKFIPLAPDLAVEVISPTDSASEVDEKIVQYLKAGVKMVWVVYPASRTVMAHSADGAYRLDEDAALDGGAVLPGFKLAVRDVFPA